MTRLHGKALRPLLCPPTCRLLGMIFAVRAQMWPIGDLQVVPYAPPALAFRVPTPCGWAAPQSLEPARRRPRPMTRPVRRAPQAATKCLHEARESCWCPRLVPGSWRRSAQAGRRSALTVRSNRSPETSRRRAAACGGRAGRGGAADRRGDLQLTGRSARPPTGHGRRRTGRSSG